MMKMEKYKILTEFVKDISVETKDIQTYLFVKDYISKYQLSIDIASKPTKNKLVEITTTLKFEDKQDNEKKSYFELAYVTIIKIEESVKEKKEIQPRLEKSFTDLINNAGFSNVNVKNIDFEKLYNSRSI